MRTASVAIVGGLILGAGAIAGSGLVYGHLVGMVVVWILGAYLLGRGASNEKDRWLGGLLAWAMAAKLAGSWVRFYVVTVVYEGGDAFRYYNFGVEIADIWRTLIVPEIAAVASGSYGTQFTAWVTGLLFTPYEPSMLGGFWLFAGLAFLGQAMFYFAFRRSVAEGRTKAYALLVFFWPTLIYWPSSIGKEAILLFFLGGGAWATSRLFQRFKFRWVPVIALATWLVSLVRIHVAALLLGSVLVGGLLARGPAGITAKGRRLVIAALGALAVGGLVIGLGDEFNLATFSYEEIETALSDVGETTEQGGSAVSGGVIRSPADIPAGIVKVLFQPLPHQADNAQMLAASVEGALLLGLIAWRLMPMIRNAGRLRRSPYLLFCAVYTGLFVWAWSAILNLGILARQRSLVLPFLLALVAGLGWNDRDSLPREELPEPMAPNRRADVDEPPPRRSSLARSDS